MPPVSFIPSGYRPFTLARPGERQSAPQVNSTLFGGVDLKNPTNIGGAAQQGQGAAKTLANARNRRANVLTGQYDKALADPASQARLFSGIFQEAARGITAPAFRDFQSLLNSSIGAQATRFGGSADTTEARRNEFGLADVFSRNLIESLQRLSTEGVNAGLGFIGERGRAAENAQGSVDTALALRNQAAGLLGAKEGKKNIFGQIAGAAAGAALGAL